MVLSLFASWTRTGRMLRQGPIVSVREGGRPETTWPKVTSSVAERLERVRDQASLRIVAKVMPWVDVMDVGVGMDRVKTVL